jgi:hypothetical protein
LAESHAAAASLGSNHGTFLESHAFDRSSCTNHNRSMSRYTEWIPEMARKEPNRSLAVAYQVPANTPPVDFDQKMDEVLRAASLAATRTNTSTWRAALPWQTRVFGLIPRDVDEVVELSLVHRPDLWELIVSCRPIQTHAAHAAGLAGIIFMAASVWIASGWAAGVLPAMTTILAGGLLVEVTRQWALNALERRLRMLAGDAGSALWPGRPAQIVDGV